MLFWVFGWMLFWVFGWMLFWVWMLFLLFGCSLGNSFPGNTPNFHLLKGNGQLVVKELKNIFVTIS